MDVTRIKGFNYQPSYGSSGLELWRRFDLGVIESEFSAGKKYFPHMNGIRLWLSWDAFIREPNRFASNFESILQSAYSHGLVVMPVLFNRWHDPDLDYGGIYIDHFLPGVSWVQRDAMFEPYLEAIVGAHAEDPRIFAWDLCNEPFSYTCPAADIPAIVAAEYHWLESVYKSCKRLRAQAPLCVGIHPMHGIAGLEQIEPLSDVLNIHPYFMPAESDKVTYERLLDDYARLAARVGKPLIASETCWGSLDDADRVQIVRYTLDHLKRRNIGWLAYLLNHSLIADAHRPEYGPVGKAGNLAFIEADGSLRPGHAAFNEF
jgi:hypothetical protein